MQYQLKDLAHLKNTYEPVDTKLIANLGTSYLKGAEMGQKLLSERMQMEDKEAEREALMRDTGTDNLPDALATLSKWKRETKEKADLLQERRFRFPIYNGFIQNHIERGDKEGLANRLKQFREDPVLGDVFQRFGDPEELIDGKAVGVPVMVRPGDVIDGVKYGGDPMLMEADFDPKGNNGKGVFSRYRAAGDRSLRNFELTRKAKTESRNVAAHAEFNSILESLIAEHGGVIPKDKNLFFMAYNRLSSPEAKAVIADDRERRKDIFGLTSEEKRQEKLEMAYETAKNRELGKQEGLNPGKEPAVEGEAESPVSTAEPRKTIIGKTADAAKDILETAKGQWKEWIGLGSDAQDREERGKLIDDLIKSGAKLEMRKGVIFVNGIPMDQAVRDKITEDFLSNMKLREPEPQLAKANPLPPGAKILPDGRMQLADGTILRKKKP